MRLVVTGASGNIGTALLRRLAASDHEITGVARRPPQPTGPYAGVRWRSADLADPASLPVLQEVVAGADAVVHLAWGFQPSHRIDHLARLGVGGTAMVADAVRDQGVPHLVHVSSVGAYSPRTHRERVDESWPRRGVPGSPYSSHKVAAEDLLDALEGASGAPVVTRLRPALVGQAEAASGLLRYGAPLGVRSALLRHVPLVPLPRDLLVPVVHADDVAAALVAALERRPSGAFNVGAGEIDAGDVAEALGAPTVHVPFPVVRAAVEASWRAHLQPLDTGWIRLAERVPLLDSGRARDVLGWTPTRSARAVLDEVVAAMASGAAGTSPPLRARTAADDLRALVTRGPVGLRRLP
jgi:UDP-glucose 4-epimerase